MAVSRQPISPVKTLTLCSVMASITAILQLSAVFVPAAGHFISAFCTLPVALAAVISPTGGIYAIVVAALIVFSIQPLETPVLLLTSAPLGWLLAAGLVHRWPKWLTLAAAFTVFFSGTALITYITGQLAAGGAFSSLAFYRLLIFNAFITILYTAAWEVFVRRVIARLTIYFPWFFDI